MPNRSSQNLGGPAYDEIDRDGDTLFILKHPNAPFASGNVGSRWPDHLPQYRSLESRFGERILELKASIALLQTLSMDCGSTDTERAGVISWVSEPEQIVAKHIAESTTSDEGEVHIRVSSKHLTFSCDFFQGWLAHKHMESSANAGYKYVVSAQDWDHEALRRVMNIIHGRTRHLPREIDLEDLAKIAAIVDYYKCHRTVEFFVRTWIENLGDRLPSCYSSELLFRLFVSCVFEEKEIFRRLTRLVILVTRGAISDLGLPPLARIAGKRHGNASDLRD